MALKKKKQLEQQAQKYNAHQNTLQQAAFNIETANNHKEMVLFEILSTKDCKEQWLSRKKPWKK